MTNEPQSTIFAGGGWRWPAATALNFYEANYDVIFTRHLTPGRKCFLPSKSPQICRFCHGQSPKVSFKSKAHAISALTGNTTLFTREECDGCNDRFGTLEDDFGKFTLPARMFAQVARRGGIPKVRIPTGRMEMRDNTLSVWIDREALDMTVAEDPASQTLAMSVPLKPYRPLAVYKALLKMALTVAPCEELGVFGFALQWLNSDGIESNIMPDCFGFRCIQSYGAKIYPVSTTVRLLRRKPTSAVPYATFILEFGGVTYQIFLPSNGNDAHLHGIDVALKAFPPRQMISGKSADDWAKFEVLDLSSPSRVTSAFWKVDLSYQQREIFSGTS